MLLVLAVPLIAFNSTSILVALMNASFTSIGYSRHENVPYGNERTHQLDVYVPAGVSRAPVVIFWHGGMWRKGSKDEVRFVGTTLARAGYVAVIPNYRLYPNARYPDFLNDGARVVAWTRDNIGKFAGNPESVFLMGHSAGAYIATMLAFDDRFLREYGESAKCLGGVIGLSGPYSFERPAVLVDAIFGKSPGVAWRPIDVVSAEAPPTAILHGEADNVVWVGEAKALNERLGALGVSSLLRTYANRSHQDLLIAWWEPLQFRAAVRNDVQDFIDQQLGRSATRTSCNS